MGRGMAANLVRAGYDLAVYNRTRAAAEQIGAMGAAVVNTPAEAACGRDVVIAMLADPPAIQSAVLGPGGVIEGLESGSVLVDCSTVDPATTAATRAAAAAKGAAFLDAPVAGSKDAAAKGELILMVGGDQETLDRVRAILDAVGRKIVHAGPSGSGTSLKLSFNLLVGHVTAGLAEALVLGMKSGVKPETLLEALMSSMLGSRFIEWKSQCIMDHDFTTNFSTRLMHKDLNLMMSAAYDLEVPLPSTAAVKELFSMARGHGEADEDICAVVKVLEDLAGVEVRR